ncbi:branched-chain amino acid ABC transporter substrate-binding protein [Aureimonas ureilytica]|uniref:Branched-chain amino acid ABC transporter substrate-binding protein n=1 Tax=Aureimonas ureilytica TaxID=401562 RepID=A0A175R5R6_9HYPH|nr:ABC transporter ATP-binding protein [Aureimonas ureilytica]KTQ85429.1 branched-chain amino acid ABC transporter substrate-binding protein [Aureimonas ureilytica]
MDDVLLEARNLSKRYGGLHAVADVTLSVRRGEIHAVIGPNGAGKSTLVNLLSGDAKLSGGAIALSGRDVTGLGPDARALAGIARSYQKTMIFPGSTVFENVRLAAQARAPKPLRMFGAAIADADVNAKAEAAVAEVGLTSRIDTVARDMSHGEQRQLEIAMVLATDPTVILLDEPLAGMGHAEAQRVVSIVLRLKAGRAVVLVEHDMDAVFALADRLTVMADGRVIGSGNPDEVRNHPAVRAAYLGHDHGVAA